MKLLLALLLCLTLPAHSAEPLASAPAAIFLDDFKLVADLSGDHAAFTLTATARVESSKGGSLEILSGPVALTDVSANPKWRVRAEQNRFILVFDRSGKFPIQLKFNAAVRRRDTWKSVDFRVAQSALQRITLKGLAEDTQFDFTGAARPEHKGSDFISYLPADGAVNLAWKEARTEVEGKLFYAVEMHSQISLSPGLMRQVALLDCKVMQGELNRISLLLRGPGEVTRVLGEQVLAWNLERASNSAERRLVIQFNQPQKDQFALQVQMQTPLAAFPQTSDALQLRPEGATRFAGYFRIVNEGAVRLEVAQATGLSQISPEQFPETEATKAALRPTGTQRFAYRFSGGDFTLRIQADQVFPELSVSQVLAYRLGDNELAIEAEIELDIREAPLRELLLRVPKGYILARVNAPGMNDYFLRDLEGAESELRLVYGQPVSGRQVVQLRLERNQPLAAATWTLPRVDIPRAKSVRGHLGVAADAGFRLTPERTQGLTEIATAFFPRKLAGLQAAFRLSDAAWQAALRVERLPQTVQVDAFHLFSIGEGIAYGSSVMNYVVTGAPVGTFKIELSDEYFNVEFTGKDIRNWQKTEGGYLVQLHTPVSGPYTLLATYERPFKAQGETLAFTGARPLDAQTEQGHTLIISAYQFQVKPVDVSSGLLPLETGEVPPEYRLFFDSPVLAAYRYGTRPFNLRLALSPLAQGDSLSQVVDRATLITRISKEGQVLTDVRYFVKNRGNPHFRLTLPPGTTLWAASVNGSPVVPVKDSAANLIPLPQRSDPDAILTLDLKLAAPSADAKHVTVEAPTVSAPVMLAEWKLEPDTNQRLVYRQGSLTPLSGVTEISGFAGLVRMFTGYEQDQAFKWLAISLVFLAATFLAWRWAARPGSRRLPAQYFLGVLAGCLCLVIAAVAMFNLGEVASRQTAELRRDISFLAPVQQAGSQMKVEVANLPEKASAWSSLSWSWPALLAAVVWGYGWLARRDWFKSVGWMLGWLLLLLTALQSPNGALAYLAILAAFLAVHVVFPSVARLWRMRGQAAAPTRPEAEGGAAPAVAAWLVGWLVWMELAALNTPRALAATNDPPAPPPVKVVAPLPMADSVTHEIRIEDKFALATARIRWQAEKGQTLPLLCEPGILTRIAYPSNSLKLIQGVWPLPGASQGKRSHQLVAQKKGSFDIELQYQLQPLKREKESGVTLPVQFGLINRMNLTVVNSDVDVVSPQAVSVQRDNAGSNTVASLVLAPGADVWVAWRPRSRDVKREKPVFYAELSQLYVPAAGVIEGAHFLSLRPAQGELTELILDIPAGATVTDVIDPSRATPQTKSPEGRVSATSIVSQWRFDPDSRKLRIALEPPQSRPFTLLVRSQTATGPLPFEQSLGLVSVENAASQIGLLGVATGNEVQLDNVKAEHLSPINLEDFSGEAGAALQAQIPSATVRRAFRYSDSRALATLSASAVEPDVRVETQDTLSVGEDRTVLAANLSVNITRAGIFRLSFVMPAGFDVEAISGPALSHWTEAKTDEGRVITLHLGGKLEGQQQFAISLAGPGVKAAKGWTAPQLLLREAGKQRGTLLVVPEQGLRLQVASRDGLTQLDPQKSGIRQKGVLAFRVLQTPWKLALDLEQVDPWVQVTSLQHAALTESQVKVLANLQYQIENTGLKVFKVFIPTNADGVRFLGDQVADFLPVAGMITNGLQQWEVRLHRRVIGPYLLQANYQVVVPEQATETVLRGVQASDVNLQRGFVTVQSAGRLQLAIATLPEALQPTEWQSIPRSLQQDLQTAAANFAYRLVEPVFQLPIKLERYEAAKLLAARVNSITFNTAISDDGVMLTQVRLELQPGDKRLLNLTLPPGASFWFAFVNHKGVWPWREQDRILVPLEQQSRGGQAIPVDIFYSCKIGKANPRALDLELLAPKFDLPLENVTWRVSLNDKWQIKHWSGSLELAREEVGSPPPDSKVYLEKEATLQRQRTKEAEGFLAAGNSALEQGDPQQARRAFQAAYGLSGHDAAFNEDARVQLHNLKLQQALVGLNVRQSAASGDAGALANKLRELRGRKEANYTQQDAKDIIDRNTADDNSAFMRLAERIIQQQDAAVTTPAAIRATIPEQGRVLTFKRSVVVDALIGSKTDLKIGLQAKAARAASTATKTLVLTLSLLLLALLAWAGKWSRREMPSNL